MWLVIIPAFIAGCFACYIYISKVSKPKKKGEYVIIYDGIAYEYHRCKRVASGVELPDKTILPITVLHQLDVDTGLSVYVAGVNQIALSEHRAFEIGRKGIVFSSIFKGGGDIGDWLQIGATCLVIGFLIYSFMNQSAISNLLTQQNAKIQVVSDILSKPLEVKK